LISRGGVGKRTDKLRESVHLIPDVGETALIDPRECRANAALCIDMASKAHGDVERHATLCHAAEMWRRLADHFERAERDGASGAEMPRAARAGG
jgi:hypothetical protein